MEQYLTNISRKRDIVSAGRELLKNPRFWYGAALLAASIFLLAYATLPPREFLSSTAVRIEEGMSLADISEALKQHNVIRSETLFEFLVIASGGEKRVMAGSYFFTEPISVFSAAYRLTHGMFGMTAVRVTFPEGISVWEMSDILFHKLSNFDTGRFAMLASSKEGYLFPDTYFFLPNASPDDVVKLMTENFNRKIAMIKETIAAFGISVHDAVIMASILEKEAATSEDRRIISGILWKRISIEMPLQVDAAFLYVNGKTTKNLRIDDLKIDSPYNTYRYKGLPKGPIGNPGLEALEDAASPQSSPYLYYLSDDEGTIYYAKNFEEHKKNKGMYLGNI